MSCSNNHPTYNSLFRLSKLVDDFRHFLCTMRGPVELTEFVTTMLDDVIEYYTKNQAVGSNTKNLDDLRFWILFAFYGWACKCLKALPSVPWNIGLFKDIIRGEMKDWDPVVDPAPQITISTNQPD